jgi:hypothetical protein
VGFRGYFAQERGRRFFMCMQTCFRCGAWLCCAYLFGGWFTRIARGALWAGSITGGEASQNLCSEKEGFTHPWLWRAPCFWGTYEWKLHAVDT